MVIERPNRPKFALGRSQIKVSMRRFVNHRYPIAII